MKIELVAPSEAYRDSFLRAMDEFQAEGLPWWFGGGLETAERDFAGFVASKLGDVGKTHRWAVADGEFVGRIAVFHELTDALRISGGHIGYDTLPSLRGRGIATQMLAQILPTARALGLSEVLLTCDDTNTASIRVIEKNGGVLRDTRVLAPTKPAKRYYWISTQ